MPLGHKPLRAYCRLTITASGDSYTTTNFDPKKEQPSLSNPFGNPSLPKSSSIHQKWIHYLTLTYNSSNLQTYNMASSGATMDAFVRFYHEQYMPYYGITNHTSAKGWNSTNSLFATFFGINDVRRCTDQPLTKDDCSEIYASLFTIYGFLLEQVSRPLHERLITSFFLFRCAQLNPIPSHTALHHRRPQFSHPQHPTLRQHAFLPPMGSSRPPPRRLRLEQAPPLPGLRPDPQTSRRHRLPFRHARALQQSDGRPELLPPNSHLQRDGEELRQIHGCDHKG